MNELNNIKIEIYRSVILFFIFIMVGFVALFALAFIKDFHNPHTIKNLIASYSVLISIIMSVFCFFKIIFYEYKYKKLDFELFDRINNRNKYLPFKKIK